MPADWSLDDGAPRSLDEFGRKNRSFETKDHGEKARTKNQRVQGGGGVWLKLTCFLGGNCRDTR